MTTTARPRKTLPGVITSSVWRPPMICVYGPPGIGKSTFGAGAPNPVFAQTEAGVENLDIARFPVPETLDEYLATLTLVANEQHDYQTVVIDTLNGVLDLYHRAKKDVKDYDFVSFSGHSGWGGVAKDIKIDLLPLLTKCQKRGMYVVVLAHASEYTRKNPFGDDLVVASPSVHKQVWKEIHGHMDVVGRADYIYTPTRIGKTSKAKASTDDEIINGQRVKMRRLSFEAKAEQDCKARIGYELPATMPLSWEAFAGHLGSIESIADEVDALWHHLDDEKAASTLEYLGVDSREQLAKAERSKLSRVRNRLLELEAHSSNPTTESEKDETNG